MAIKEMLLSVTHVLKLFLFYFDESITWNDNRCLIRIHDKKLDLHQWY